MNALVNKLVNTMPARTHCVTRPRWSVAVDLVGAYSKRQDLADQLRRVLDRLGRAHQEPAEDPRESVRTTAKAAEPHRVVDRLGEQAVRELVEAFEAGTSKWRLSEQYGISLSSVKRLIRNSDEVIRDVLVRTRAISDCTTVPRVAHPAGTDE